MIRELTEKTMGLRLGEQRFSKEMRDAFFGIGLKPPQFSERIEEVKLREEGFDRFNVVLDLVRTLRPEGYDVRSLVPTIGFDDRDKADSLVEDMNDPFNLARANRVLDVSGRARDWGIITGATGLAVVGSIIVNNV